MANRDKVRQVIGFWFMNLHHWFMIGRIDLLTYYEKRAWLVALRENASDA